MELKMMNGNTLSVQVHQIVGVDQFGIRPTKVTYRYPLLDSYTIPGAIPGRPEDGYRINFENAYTIEVVKSAKEIYEMISRQFGKVVVNE